MIDKHVGQGITDALVHFKVANAPPGILDRLKTFGQGQMGAAKSLAGNLRAGFGGASPHALPEGMEGPVPGGAGHRQMALGNMRSLAPSLAIGGGAYMLHRHNQAQDQEARQRAMMMQQGYGGQPTM